jgi:outer membrane lipoprotein carrier protein
MAAVAVAAMLAVGGWVPAEEINVPTLTPEERLTTILSGFDDAQENTDTLVAAFQERKNLQMLRDPVESSGRFYYSKPHRVKWEYREPESKIYLLTEESYMAYYPEQKRAEKVNVQRYSDKLFRAFGIGQTTSELKKYYDIELADESGVDGAYLMVLLPKKRRIQKRIETLKIWVSDDSFLPVQMEYVEPDGDSTVLSFEQILINQEILASRFQIHLPSDVIVTDSFTGIGGIGQQ